MARDALADTNTEPLKNSSVIFRLLMLKHHRTEQKQTEKTSIHRLWQHWNDIQWRARMSLSDVFPTYAIDVQVTSSQEAV